MASIADQLIGSNPPVPMDTDDIDTKMKQDIKISDNILGQEDSREDNSSSSSLPLHSNVPTITHHNHTNDVDVSPKSVNAHLIAWHTTNNIIQKTKLQIYSEMKRANERNNEEGREDAHDQFIEYWDTLGEYILASRRHAEQFVKPTSNNFIRSNHADTGGIEAILQSFLITKKLKKLHNQMILAIMKQCLQPYVPKNKVKGHAPTAWKKKMKLVKGFSKQRDTPRDYSKILQKEKQEREKIQQELGSRSNLLSDNYHYQEGIYTRPSMANILPTGETESTTYAQPSIPFTSVRLPASLDLNLMVRKIVEKEGGSRKVTVSDDILWTLASAVREYVIMIINNTIMNKETTENSMGGNDESILSSTNNKDNMTRLGKKRKLISCIDIAHTLCSMKSQSMSARIGWERCIATSELNNQVQFLPIDRDAQAEINDTILNTAAEQRKRRKIVDTAPGISSSSGMNDHGIIKPLDSNISEDHQSVTDRRLSQGLGRGKDLLSMKARQSSIVSAAAEADRRISISSLMSSSDTMQLPQDLNNHPSMMAAVEEQIDYVSLSSLQGLGRDSVSPIPQQSGSVRQRGRGSGSGSGLGSKDLMAMRARNSLTLSQPSSATTSLSSSRPGSGFLE